MEDGDGQSPTILRTELRAWKTTANRWRSAAKRLLRCERIRFRGMVSNEVWERDLIIAPTLRWEKLVGQNPEYRLYSTATCGPLTLALSPPAVVDTSFGREVH